MIKNIKFIDDKVIKNHNFSNHIDDNKNGFNLYMNCGFIGKPKSGKTHAAIKLANYLQEKKLITNIYLASPTIQSNPFEILNIPEENQFSDINNSDEILNEIEIRCKNNVIKWKELKNRFTEKQYKKLYKSIFNIFSDQINNPKENNIFNDEGLDNEYELDVDDYEMLENNNYEKKPYYYNYGPSHLLILDDIMGTNIISNKKTNLLNSIISNHRHMHLSIFILCQSYKSGIPRAVRLNLTKYFLWKTSDNSNIQSFYDEIGNSYFSNYDEFKNLFQNITKHQYNFMLIDTDPKDDDLTIRSGFNRKIIL